MLVESEILGLESRIQLKGSESHQQLESEIQVPQIKNPESSIWSPESTAWNPECKTVLDSLTWGELGVKTVYERSQFFLSRSFVRYYNLFHSNRSLIKGRLAMESISPCPCHNLSYNEGGVTKKNNKIKIKCFYGRNIKSAKEIHHQVTRKTSRFNNALVRINSHRVQNLWF